MSKSSSKTGRTTLAHGSIEDLITPRLAPGKACLIVIRGRSVGLLHELERDVACTIGRAEDVSLPLDDVAVSRQHARVESRPEGFVLTDLGSTNGVFVNGVRVRHHGLRDGDRLQIGTSTILKFCYQDELEADFQKQLYDSATRDALTRVYNRKFLLEALDVDFAAAQKNGTALSLLLIDADHFKDVNDRYGHLTGDHALVELTRVAKSALRAEDLIARYGGEEFAVLLRFTEGAEALTIAERILQSTRQHAIEHDGHSFTITVSIGAASIWLRPYGSPTEFLKDADDALYQAKDAGRDRVFAPEGLAVAGPPARPADTAATARVGSETIAGGRTMRLDAEAIRKARAREDREPDGDGG